MTMIKSIEEVETREVRCQSALCEPLGGCDGFFIEEIEGVETGKIRHVARCVRCKSKIRLGGIK